MNDDLINIDPSIYTKIGELNDLFTQSDSITYTENTFASLRDENKQLKKILSDVLESIKDERPDLILKCCDYIDIGDKNEN